MEIHQNRTKEIAFCIFFILELLQSPTKMLFACMIFEKGAVKAFVKSNRIVVFDCVG